MISCFFRHCRSGFSLLELMIVLVIIGILSAILLPNFSNITSKSQDIALVELGHTVSMALESYQLDLGHFPDSDLSGSALFELLLSHSELKQRPINPYSGLPFSNSDADDLFSYESKDSGYVIVVYNPKGDILKKFNR